MTVQATDPKDLKDLDRKIEFLEGILGFAFEKGRFRDASIAHALGISPSYWARKKGGRISVSPGELGRLVMHFGLAPRFSWEVFMKPFDEFVEEMREGRVGTYGAGEGPLALQRLLSDPFCTARGVHIARVGAPRAGLGAAPDPVRDRRVVLSVGTRARMRVDTPGRGYLVVINQHAPCGETTCLVPSLFRPSQDVAGGVVHLPADGAAQTSFDVQGPPGFYRLFALWAQTPFGPSWAREDEEEPRVLDGPHLTALVDDLLTKPQDGTSYAVHTAEYRVVC